MNKPSRLLVAGGILGTAIALLEMLIPPAVGPELWSYPHTATGFVLKQIPIVISHILTAVGILALTELVRSSRAGLMGIRMAAAALWLFAVCEVAAAAITGVRADSVPAAVVGAAFGVTSLVYAIGAVAGGVALVRSRARQPWARWSLLTSGVFVLAVVDPATFAGNLTIRYLALTLWGLMFCWIAALVPARDRGLSNARMSMVDQDPKGVSS
jgi:hypothetical protein